MFEAKHTPVPWHAAVEPHQATILADPENDGEGYIVADVMSPLGVHERDAHLIAAAPDLLAACESFVGAYPMGINKDLDEAYRAARAAIHKVKGGDQ